MLNSLNEELLWRKSSFSNGSGGNNCVEVAYELQMDRVHLRDSKNPNAGNLVFSGEEWEAFIDGVKEGEFDDRDDPADSAE